MQLLFSNTCDLFSRKLEVFSEMEMEINIINNKIFTKLYLKIRVRVKEIDLLITASVNIYQTKIPIVMKRCFS